MHRNARRGVGVGLGVMGILAILPFVVDGVADLVTGDAQAGDEVRDQ